MRILITGGRGQLGSQLVTVLEARGHTAIPTDVDEVDITRPDQVYSLFDHATPELVIHCAALTNVDYCADHPDDALTINGLGTQSIAHACLAHDAALMYISTNEVFDGTAQRRYLEYDAPHPINAYGYSKWVGEQVVRDLVQRHYIVRISWLFAPGGRNFVHTILHAAHAGKQLRVVTNEIGSPTYSQDLVQAISQLIGTGSYGIYHLINEGHTSRYAFARYLLDEAGYVDTEIEPIALAEYQRASRPPEHAVLRNFAAARLSITLRPWQDAAKAFIESEELFKK